MSTVVLGGMCWFCLQKVCDKAVWAPRETVKDIALHEGMVCSHMPHRLTHALRRLYPSKFSSTENTPLLTPLIPQQ
eukprot:m.423886 g.423886  ORF g.423886 m.423886 type:complete len:76 (-) comp20211_c5_seq21:772-999(-)